MPKGVTVAPSAAHRMGPVRLRLTRKLAEALNGIDLSRAKQGEVIEATEREAAVLMAEGWAVLAGAEPDLPRAEAADRSRRAQSTRVQEP